MCDGSTHPKSIKMNQPTALSAAIADAYDLSDEWSDLCDLPPNIDDWTASSDRYADYVVYVDESGDDALPKSKYEREQLKYPYFVLAFCIFEKDSYVRRTQPAINCLKHLLFGGDEEILHEREARKGGGIFSVLSHDTAKGCFMTALTRVIEQSDLTIISVVIRKDQIQDSDPLMDEKDVYSFAMKVELERLYEFMRSKGQERKPCRVICESRDKYQDRMVRATMRSVIDGQNVHGCRLPFVP